MLFESCTVYISLKLSNVATNSGSIQPVLEDDFPI